LYTNSNHDAYLYHFWNNKHKNTGTTKPAPAGNSTNSTPTTAYTLTEITVKDDVSTIPTLKTLCIHTLESDPNKIIVASHMLINFTIWNQPIVHYRMPNQPNTYHRSRLDPSTAVQYTLIGVYDKLLNPPKFSQLFLTVTSIVCLVLYCFVFLAASFTMVKIDDRYPDEWYD
jgi:hypothetical protein